MKKFVVLSLIAALPALAHAETYHQCGSAQARLQLQSQEGVNITLTGTNCESGDVGDSETNAVEQVQISVYGGPVNFGSHIRAVLVSNCRSELYGSAVSEPTLTSDLTAQTDGSSLDFYGQFGESFVTSAAMHGGDTTLCQPQLAVVVDGNWQTDPVTGSHNFGLLNF
jgi:hypothetical protein